MASSILEAFGTVRSDGTLELDKNVAATPGRVKVRMEYLDPPAPAAEPLLDFVDRSRRELAAAGHKFMDDAEVATWVEELREDEDRP